MANKIKHLHHRGVPDCNMPVMNGYDMTTAIRALESADDQPRCPVWGFTANAQPDEIERCRAAGMDDCLFKPISLSMLSERLAAISPLAHTPLPFSLDSVSNLTGNRPEMVERLLTQLRQSNHEDRLLLARLTPEDNRDKTRDLAHRIKGAARIISASRLVDACEALEQACEPGMPDEQLRLCQQVVELAMIELEDALILQQAKADD
ncbi:PAS protein [Pseudomonas caricapapayae]|uniref:PAS protein n=1 Tax=Pseudomonas caricapapayae TaxID=46678 RepID=A0A0P9M665_9PSED|nr:response regulator [Pseudomonas caricapapayae]KAA8692063.1 response regulator [Pseudomonas caricapapayae]KPW63077.1 PAS protein [Pseudomonas caricapapayae]RMM11385.1 PAS protein [Pseudomonas caricapapayae]